MEPIERTSLVLSAGAAAISLAVAPLGFTASLIAGSALELLNFRGLAGSARLLFGGEARGGFFRAVTGLRFLLLAVGIATALGIGADPIGLLIGLSLILPASVIEAWRHRPPIVPDAPALAPDDPAWDRWDVWRAGERETWSEEEESK